MSVWTHNELASDLAAHLAVDGRMVWENLQLGPSGSIRPDVYTMERSYTNPKPVAYECKVSRPDMMADLTGGKWMNYRSVATAVYFAVPHGMAKKSEFPEGVGVYVRSERGWAALRRATRHPFELDTDLLLKLLMDGLDLIHATTWRIQHGRHAHQYRDRHSERKRFGERVARIMADQDRAEMDAKRAVEVAKQSLEGSNNLVRDCLQSGMREVARFCSEIGIEPPEPGQSWSYGHTLRQRLDQLHDDTRIKNAILRVERAREEVESALSALRPATQIRALDLGASKDE